MAFTFVFYIKEQKQVTVAELIVRKTGRGAENVSRSDSVGAKNCCIRKNDTRRWFMSRIRCDTTFLCNIRVKVTVAASVNPFVGEGLALHVSQDAQL